jgi:hypothetical protein
MHGPINVKSSNNISKWQMGFNSVFKGLKLLVYINPDAKWQSATALIPEFVFWK